MKLKMLIEPSNVKKSVYDISAFEEVPAIISALYGLSAEEARTWVTDCLLFHGWNNGHVVTDDIEKCEFIEYEEWVKTMAPPNKDFIDGDVGAILSDAANHDLIPEGFYVIRWSW